MFTADSPVAAVALPPAGRQLVGLPSKVPFPGFDVKSTTLGRLLTTSKSYFRLLVRQRQR